MSESKYLVIVESPTKARTILAILGKEYEVLPSMGHIIDLPSKKIAVDLEGDFSPQYRVLPGKEKIISQIKKKAKNKEAIYIATDPDREGEAIGWHIKDKLSASKAKFYRVIFHEITQEALQQAFRKPTHLDINKVNAQVARRVLDRVVGYSLSPLLWKKIVRGLSAGRVQSVALKFIEEREKEIEKFVPTTTYGVKAKFKLGHDEFEARLDKFKGIKAPFKTRDEAKGCIEQIKKEAFLVKDIVKRTSKRKPPSPYTTSLLQQDAFNKLRFSSSKTMVVAQKLYEGIKIDDESLGLITYMRTDSFHIAPKAKQEIKKFIHDTFGDKYLAEKEHRYKAKKGAQLAHEAIRPTSAFKDPSALESFLTHDEDRLYGLIWKRTIASFMRDAEFQTTKAILKSSHAEFIGEGKEMLFDGFLRIFGKEEELKSLPKMHKAQEIELRDCNIVEHTTKPPPRFNDASLVRLLEEKGIGRPSTYSPIIYTLLFRNYVRREKGSFVITDLGIKVSELLSENFPKIINDNFTALMEEKLDEVEEGQLEWKSVLSDFYPSFKKSIDQAAKTIKKEVNLSDKKCPKCGSPLAIKWSRKGKFLSCSTFPKCRYAESITTKVKCPDCKEGELIQRRNKRGQIFYGCTGFPNCRYTSRDLPSQDDAESSQSTNENTDEKNK